MLNGISLTCPNLTINFNVNDVSFEPIKGSFENILGDKQILFPYVHFQPKRIEDTTIEVAFSYDNELTSNNIVSFCNTIRTHEDGSHVTGFKRALSTKLSSYISEKKLSKELITPDDIYQGLNAYVSVFSLEPKYSSQTKQKLTNNEVLGNVITYMNEELDIWLNSNPKEIKIIVDKISLSAKARLAQKRALENVKKDNTTLS